MNNSIKASVILPNLMLIIIINLFLGCKQKANKFDQNQIDPLQKIANEYWESGSRKDLAGDYQGAIQEYTRAIEYAPESSSFYTDRGAAKSSMEDYIGAINDYTKAIQLDNEKNQTAYRAYRNRGIAKFFLQDYRGAISDINMVIVEKPESYQNESEMWLYYYRGLSKIGLGDKDNGCLDLSKAGELGLAKAYTAIKIYCQ